MILLIYLVNFWRIKLYRREWLLSNKDIKGLYNRKLSNQELLSQKEGAGNLY